MALERLFGATFAASSVITPFFLGTVAGAIAVRPRPAPGPPRPTPSAASSTPHRCSGGALAVVACAYLAAVYLTADARRAGKTELVEAFRRRALASGAAAGAIARGASASSTPMPRSSSTDSTAGAARWWPLSALAGLVSLGCVWQRRFVGARFAAAAAVTAVLWGWAAGQYPDLLTGELTIATAAAAPVAIRAVLLSLAVGAVFVLPGLVALFLLAQREPAGD